jgi:uncharacterized membrane protein YkoI
MIQRTARIIATTITAFVLALAGGVAAYLATQPQPAATPTATAIAAVATTAPEPGLDPTAVQAAIKQRDAAYQQRIAQANQQLQLANQQLSQAYQKQQELAGQLNRSYQQQQLLASQLKHVRQQPAPIVQARQAAAQPAPTAPVPMTPPAPAVPTYAISPDAATAIALGATPGTILTRAPELVSFQGIVAYEVLLDRGTVYVDANSGQILYNGAAVAVTSGGDRHEGGEHEGGGDD